MSARLPRAVCWIAVAIACAMGCRRAASSPRVVVLGFDGLDYRLTRDLISEGQLPNFAKLAQQGTFQPLQSTIPPQSPVAWSSFITGLDPGGHGIFDFIHRDPSTMVPYLSTTITEPARAEVKLGRWQFPLVGGSVKLLRRGQPFWDVLGRDGVETTVVRMPANFPPSGSATRELSGMGTPDLLGTYGTFSYYTSNPDTFDKRTVSGGNIYPVDIIDGVVTATIDGPDNPFLRKPEPMRSPFTVYLDDRNPVVRIVAGSEERILKAGEWSDWVPVEFEPAPMQRIHGMSRFYLKRVRPFELYVTPVNLDPFAPAMPLSTPGSYAAELAKATGRFYTQGISEDTAGLRAAILSRPEFLQQTRLVIDEQLRQYRHVLDGFRSGLLFYYFGHVDQVSHMFWRTLDPEHPAYDPVDDPKYRHVIPDLYRELDRLVGDTLAQVGGNTLVVVMSDHGFTSWRRSFHLNAWLRDNGYLAVLDPALKADPGLFANIDWSRTRAYALGLNGLYVNQRGRERHGIVPKEEGDRLLAEIEAKLGATVDAETGLHPVARVFLAKKVYRGADARIAPDAIIGYADGYRSSNESSLGGVPPTVITNNTDAWSGDHCIDPSIVPGVLLTSRPLSKPAASLETLGAAILAEYGVGAFPVSP